MISTVLPAFKYLIEERKLNEETIRAFHLSYCAKDGEIYVDADFTETFPTLPQVFKHSSLFPICDMYGSVVGVSARPLVSMPNQPKYINTVYDKAKHLYGLSVTWQQCINEQKAYVVEGNVDVLQMWQAGMKNVVGMLGSNFSFTQLCLLNRFVKKVVFVPDGDSPGTKWRDKLKTSIPKKFYDADMKFFYVQLPTGMDPDNFLKKFGREEFLKLPEQEFKI